MTKALLWGVVGSLVGVGAAVAADLPRKAPQAYAAAPAWNWTGGYAGIHGGYGWGSADHSFPDAGGIAAYGPVLGGAFGFDQNIDGFAGGFHIGYNQQFGSLVFGLESASTWTSIKGKNTGVLATLPNATYETRVDWVSTFTPRIGFAVNNWLVYGKVGLAYARAESRISNPAFAGGGATFREKTDYAGWTVGVGVEYALTQNWVLGVEYNYYNFGSERMGGLHVVGGAVGITGPDYNVDLAFSSVLARLSYKFGSVDPITAMVFNAPAAAAGPWTGMYVGIHGGYAWGDSDYAFPLNGGFATFVAPNAGGRYNQDLDGGMVGGHIGYMRQLGSWVLGTEASLSWTGLKGSTANPFGLVGLDASVLSLTNTTELDWLATVTTRVGYSFGPWLAYGKGGVAVGEVKSSFTVNRNAAAVINFTEKNDHVGWTLGAGLEYAFSPNWVVGVEYNYYDLGKEQYGGLAIPNLATSGGQYEADLKFSSVLARLSYKFGGPGPVVARY